jgi:hypothetical protein
MDASLEKLPNWLRWALTPIASVVTFIVVFIVANIAAKIFVFVGGPGGWSINFFEYILVPGVAAYCAVLVTGILAPDGKQMTAVIYAAIWVSLCGVITVFALVSGEYKGLLPVISIVVGCASAALSENL